MEPEDQIWSNSKDSVRFYLIGCSQGHHPSKKSALKALDADNPTLVTEGSEQELELPVYPCTPRTSPVGQLIYNVSWIGITVHGTFGVMLGLNSRVADREFMFLQ